MRRTGGPWAFHHSSVCSAALRRGSVWPPWARALGTTGGLRKRPGVRGLGSVIRAFAVAPG